MDVLEKCFECKIGRTDLDPQAFSASDLWFCTLQPRTFMGGSVGLAGVVAGAAGVIMAYGPGVRRTSIRGCGGDRGPGPGSRHPPVVDDARTAGGARAELGVGATDLTDPVAPPDDGHEVPAHDPARQPPQVPAGVARRDRDALHARAHGPHN